MNDIKNKKGGGVHMPSTRWEWMCTKCGKKIGRFESEGRPQPGSCPKNNHKEHKWVKNKKI